MGVQKRDVVIVGAGISGLTCARVLSDAGVDFIVLDRSEAIGGRIRSDRVAGFILDHGFQVLQTAYPEAGRVLDFGKLGLKAFWPGVALRKEDRFFHLSDPVRKPRDIWATLTAPVGSFADRLRMLKLLADNRRIGVKGIFASPDLPADQFLKDYGFSKSMRDQFFRPFFAGACLDPEIQASSRVFRYLFDIFARGDAALPADGMGAIPAQLAEGLPETAIRLNTWVVSLEDGRVVVDTGEQIRARKIVVAAEGPETARLLNQPTDRPAIGEKCLYFAAATPPVSRPALMLNSHKGELINNIAVPSLTAPTYSATGEALIAVVVLGNRLPGGQALEQAVRRELIQWFGPETTDWRHIRTYEIDHALPDQSPPMTADVDRVIRVGSHIYCCGEYRQVPGIQWALRSGRLAGQAVLEDLGKTERGEP